MLWSWNVVRVPKIRKLFLFNYVCGFYIDALNLFSRNDVTLGPFLLYVIDDIMVLTYWLLAIDVKVQVTPAQAWCGPEGG
jgi:hypothetical protein